MNRPENDKKAGEKYEYDSKKPEDDSREKNQEDVKIESKDAIHNDNASFSEKDDNQYASGENEEDKLVDSEKYEDEEYASDNDVNKTVEHSYGEDDGANEEELNEGDTHIYSNEGTDEKVYLSPGSEGVEK